MGMFDYVKVEVPLPDGQSTDMEFQTKDSDFPYMETYTIRADGRLIHDKPVYDCDPPGSVAQKIDMNYHGIWNFYGHNKANEWREYNAKFTDGTLVNIEAVSPTTRKESA